MTDVLLVEDDDALRADLAFVLGREGFNVTPATDGRDALAQLRAHARPPSVILLDLVMPVMNGWVLRQELLADPALARIPVVVLSGRDDIGHQARELGAVDFVWKPIDLDRLMSLLARLRRSAPRDVH